MTAVTPRMFLVGAVVLTALVAWAVAWVTAIAWLASGHRLLPPPKPRPVPWGPLSIFAAFLVWLTVSLCVSGAYFLARGKPASPGLLTARIGRAAGVAAGPKATRPASAPKATTVAAAPKASPAPRDLLVCQSIILVLVLVLTPCALYLLSGATLEDLGLIPRAVPMALVRGLGAWLLLAPVSYGLMIGLNILLRALDPSWMPDPHPVLDAVRTDPTGRTALLVVVLAVLLAPASEELFFRGLLLPWLRDFWWAAEIWLRGARRETKEDETEFEPLEMVDGHALAAEKNRGPWWVRLIPRPLARLVFQGRLAALLPNVLVSVVFAGLHFPQWPAPIPLFFLSLGLGLLIERTGSLFASFFLHAFFNGFSTTVMLLAVWAGVPIPEKTSIPPAQKAGAQAARSLERSCTLEAGIGAHPGPISRPPHIL